MDELLHFLEQFSDYFELVEQNYSPDIGFMMRLKLKGRMRLTQVEFNHGSAKAKIMDGHVIAKGFLDDLRFILGQIASGMN